MPGICNYLALGLPVWPFGLFVLGGGVQAVARTQSTPGRISECAAPSGWGQTAPIRKRTLVGPMCPTIESTGVAPCQSNGCNGPCWENSGHKRPPTNHLLAATCKKPKLFIDYKKIDTPVAVQKIINWSIANIWCSVAYKTT